VNSTTTKLAPKGSIDQLGHSLSRIIHAVANTKHDDHIFWAKWDIKDGFWRLDCEDGKEWNFAYVLPSSHGQEPTLIVPTSLQMGWIESPPYFCAASETARDVAEKYSQRPLGSLPTHKFLHYTQLLQDFRDLAADTTDPHFRYLLEVFVDDFIAGVIARAQSHLNHVSLSVMHGIHEVFPPDAVSADDAISEKKLIKGDGSWAHEKEILGMTFNGKNKTIWLSTDKRDAILSTLSSWIRHSAKHRGIPFKDFQSTLSKLQHAFITVPAGKGLLSPFYTVLAVKPDAVYLHRNTPLRTAVRDCRTFLRETISDPMPCSALVTGWPDFIGITDASGHGLGGVILGENSSVQPTVFRLQWPPDITASIISSTNPTGTITNSDLELAGLFMLWLVMEDVCHPLANTHVALFSDNSPTVHWVQRLAAKHSQLAMQLIRALALRLQLQRASPLTPLHIAGVDNAMTDIPSRSFGSDPKWHCKTDTDLARLFNASFPLPNQGLWTVYHLSSDIATRLISVLRMKPFSLDDWRRLPQPGTNTGRAGQPMSHLWEWTHTYRKQCTSTKLEHCQDLQPEYDPDITDAINRSELAQSLQLSQPLGRRYPWPKG
jgi:hypothetical protein